MVKPGSPAGEPPSQAGPIPDACRKVLQIRPRTLATKKKKKLSLVGSLLEYLTSDCFMYGPLLTPPSPPSPPKNRALQKSSETCDIPGPTSLVPEHPGASNLTSLHSPSSTPISRLRSMSTITKRILGKMALDSGRNRASVLQAPVQVPYNLGQEALQVPSPKEKLSDKNEANGNGLVTSEGEDEEEENNSFEENESSKSFSESLSELNVTPLSKESATEVARKVVRKVGGRFSKELGIFVDGRDSEVERWFLATTFFNQPSDFEQSRRMFKKLQSMGISKIQDVLAHDQSELEEAFESTMRNYRIAARLRKIAFSLHAVHGNGICVFKRVPDFTELKRDLESLSGYSRHAANTFMREMRGVWPGANPDFEVRTRNAAKHLHLLSSSQGGAAATSALLELGHDAGLDVRDLELALLKVSFQHARQYRSCPGGRDCETTRITLSDVDHLIASL